MNTMKHFATPIGLLALLLSASTFAALAAPPVADALFKQALEGKADAFAALPDAPLSKEAEKAERAAQWEAYKSAAAALGWDKNPAAWPDAPAAAKPGERRKITVVTGVLPCDGETMPYGVLTKGDQPGEHGWPLFFQTHGGGSTDEKLPGPHAWPANTQDWHAQFNVIAALLPPGRYFVPRMANDNKGRLMEFFTLPTNRVVELGSQLQI